MQSHWITLNIPARSRVIIPEVVVVMPGLGIVILAGEPQVVGEGACGCAVAEGVSPPLPDDFFTSVSNVSRRVQLIGLHVIQAAWSNDSDGPVIQPDVLRNQGASGGVFAQQVADLVIDEQRGDPAHGLLNSLTQGVVLVGVRAAAGSDARQAVGIAVGVCVGAISGHITVGIVTVVNVDATAQGHQLIAAAGDVERGVGTVQGFGVAVAVGIVAIAQAAIGATAGVQAIQVVIAECLAVAADQIVGEAGDVVVGVVAQGPGQDVGHGDASHRTERLNGGASCHGLLFSWYLGAQLTMLYRLLQLRN